MTKRMWAKLCKLGVIEEIKSRDLVVLVVNGRRGYLPLGSYCLHFAGSCSVQVLADMLIPADTEEKALEYIISSIDTKTILERM